MIADDGDFVQSRAKVRSVPLIFTALRYEANAIASAVDARIEVIGLRAALLPRIDVGGAGAIILAGLAGALDPSLAVGDVIVDERSTSEVLPDLPRRRIHTAKQMICTAAEKSELFRSSGGAAAVDMEADAVFTFAAERKLPCLHIRAISDAADHAIDPAVFRLTDSSGNVRPTALARELIRKPSLVAELVRLQSRSKLALRNLCEALNQLGNASEKKLSQLR